MPPVKLVRRTALKLPNVQLASVNRAIGRREKKTTCNMRAVLIQVVEDKVAKLYRTITLGPAESDRIQAAVLAEVADSNQDAPRTPPSARRAEEQAPPRTAASSSSPLRRRGPDRTSQERAGPHRRTLLGIEQEQASLATDVAEARANLDQILTRLEGCEETYRLLPEHLKRLKNQACFDRILVDLDDDGQTPKLAADLEAPLEMLIPQLRAAGAPAAAQHETSPIPKDEARLASCATARRTAILTARVYVRTMRRG